MEAGAVLMQAKQNEVDCLVSYFPKENSHELNYSIVEKEALALIWALEYFEVHVGDGVRPSVVYTDHNPQTFLHSVQNPKSSAFALVSFPAAISFRHTSCKGN